MYGKTWLEIFGVLDALFQGEKIQPTLVWAFIIFVKLVPMLFVSFTKMLPVLLTVQPCQSCWVRENIGFMPHCASPYSGIAPCAMALPLPLLHRYIPIYSSI